MTNLTAESYRSLAYECNEYAYAYYILDSPTISDQEYDKKYQLLKTFEQHNPLLIDPKSPTQFVGYTPQDTFKSFIHPTPLTLPPHHPHPTPQKKKNKTQK